VNAIVLAARHREGFGPPAVEPFTAVCANHEGVLAADAPFGSWVNAGRIPRARGRRPAIGAVLACCREARRASPRPGSSRRSPGQPRMDTLCSSSLPPEDVWLWAERMITG
jgi:hypothetical protein